MRSTTLSASEITISSKSCLNQPRSQLNSQSLAKLEPYEHSHTRSADRPEHSNHASAVRGANIDPHLLSPPLSVHSLDAPPFKAAESDPTSISMKHPGRRRARRHRRRFDHASTGDAEQQQATQHHPLSKRLNSTSMPNLRDDKERQLLPSLACQLLGRQKMQAIHRAYRRDSIARFVGSERRASLPRKPRRWTMPSKAASTRVLSGSPTPAFTTTLMSNTDRQQSPHAIFGALNTSQPRRSVSTQAENKRKVGKRAETPAMITLKRATSKKGSSPGTRRTSLRPSAITSFPPPKFNRTASTYFASFLGLNGTRVSARVDEPIQTSVRHLSWSTGQGSEASSRKASVTADKVQLTGNALVAPALTQVEFLPLSHAHTDHQETLVSARRFSTTIVSDNSVHEIIWDENIPSSSEGSTSAELSRRTSKSAIKAEYAERSRRKSVLVEKLEAQLENDNRRKAPLGFWDSNEFAPTTHRSERKESTLKLAVWSHGALNEAAKPRQNSSPMDLKPGVNHDTSPNVKGLLATLQGEDRFPSASDPVGFFPPIEGSAENSRKSSFSRQQSSPPEPMHVLVAGPRSTARVRRSVSSELAGMAKGKARSTSIHPPQPRRSSFSDHHPRMGSAIGQSAHIRRRSTDLHKAMSNSWSRIASKQDVRELVGRDERIPLLTHGERSNDPAPGHIFGKSLCTSKPVLDAGPQKMTVQDFVHKIEQMGQRALRSGDVSGDRGGDDSALAGGLIRRDSPRFPLRASAGAANIGRRQAGKSLSEVDEEGVESDEDEGVLFL